MASRQTDGDAPVDQLAALGPRGHPEVLIVRVVCSGGIPCLFIDSEVCLSILQKL